MLFKRNKKIYILNITYLLLKDCLGIVIERRLPLIKNVPQVKHGDEKLTFGDPVYALWFTCSKWLGFPIIWSWAYLEKDIPAYLEKDIQETGGATTFNISVFIIHNQKRRTAVHLELEDRWWTHDRRREKDWLIYCCLTPSEQYN